MLKGSCHCGAVKIEIDAEQPETATSCNCSICRKTGNIMIYFSPKLVRVIRSGEGTGAYIWGDKSLAFHHCKTCGVNTHWEGLDPNGPDRMGISARIIENLDWDKLRVRRFDGADTWQFLD